MERLNIIIDEKSTWKVSTPSAQAMRLPFYLLEHGHFIAYDGYFTQRDKSNQFLLFYTLDGEGMLTYLGTNYVLQKGTVCIIWCEHPHEYTTLPSESWDFLWFHFNGSTASEFYNLYNDVNTLTIQQIPSDAIDIIFSIVSTDTSSNIYTNLTQNKLITQLMTSLIEHKLRLEKDSAPIITNKINAAIVYLHNNLNQKTSLADIASYIFTSKYYFARMFKKQLGMSPYNYLLYLRINKAKEFLNTSELQLDEIAQQTGFCDAKNLIYNFKKATGITPIQYRKASINITSNQKRDNIQ